MSARITRAVLRERARTYGLVLRDGAKRGTYFITSTGGPRTQDMSPESTAHYLTVYKLTHAAELLWRPEHVGLLEMVADVLEWLAVRELVA